MGAPVDGIMCNELLVFKTLKRPELCLAIHVPERSWWFSH